MVVVYLFLAVLGLNDVFLTSNLENTDLVSQMIAEQSRKCPYIALCHIPNTSVSKWDVNDFFSPCCKCACNETCMKDGSCCPDYFTKDKSTKTDQPTESTTKIVAATSEIGGTECVKIQYGPIQNQKGFMMIATCPLNYDDTVVQRKCEMKLDHHQSFNLFDHVPVTDTDSGKTYKNRHCKQCNTQDSFSTFWNSMLTCEMSFIHFNFFPVKDMSTFIEKALMSVTGPRCNLVFEQEITNNIVKDTPTICAYSTMIDTCSINDSSDALQKSCNQYTWPINAYVHPEDRLYKNYACMLCSGIKFKENCLNSAGYIKATIHFTSDLNSTHEIITSSVDQQIIKRYFPNKDGEVFCKMGFVYDVRKRICRLVLCPQYFIVSDGECVPLFRNLDGVDYYLLLEADIITANKESNEELNVVALERGFYGVFQDNLGDELIRFSIWKDQNLRVKGRYFVEISFSGKFSQGRYISILKFANTMIQRILPFNKRSYVVFSFNSSIAISFDGKVFSLSSSLNDNFLLVTSYQRNGHYPKDLRTQLYISPALICYRISLSKDNVDSTNNEAYVSILNRNIYTMNLQNVMKNDFAYIYIVCLDQGLQKVARTINIFLKEKSTNYTFISQRQLTDRKNKNPKKTKNEKDKGDLNKSLVATLATVAFIAFIIIVRRIMKRRAEQQIDTYVVEYVNERNVQIADTPGESLDEEDATVKDMSETIEVP